jgi:phage FluMu gp28-like protein
MASDTAITMPYQRDWLNDASRFKIGLWSRQTGKSFVAALEAVLDAVERKTLWIFLSAGERQSRELAEKAKTHLAALKVAAEALESEFFDGASNVTQLELKIQNGSRLIFLPANPRTARGYSGNVFLDEFAFHQDSAAIWAALFPIITRRPDLKIRIMSTPNGQDNKFFELWERGGEAWSRHKLDIYSAIEQGLDIDAEELKAGLNDPLAWEQEFLVSFIAEEGAYLPYSLIATCQADSLAPEWNPQTSYLGMDIGRKRDLTVFCVLEKVGDVYWLRCLERLRGAMFSDQRTQLYDLIERARRAAIDATGLGMQLAEEARKAHGWKAEPVTFTNEVKADLAQSLRLAFEDKRLRIPDDRALRESLHAVKRTVTSAGNTRYDADRTEGGHADEFWALALALHAAETKRGPIEYKTIQAGRFSSEKGGMLA